MLAGKSGIDRITQWGDLDEVKAKYKLAEDFPLIAGEVKDFNIKDIVKQRKHGFSKEDLNRLNIWMRSSSLLMQQHWKPLPMPM